MAIFSYTAKNSQGHTVGGSVDARSSGVAVALLKEQGLFVVSIEEKRETFLDKITHLRGIPKSDIVTFTRQFSTMISAGLPIARALEVLGNQTTNNAFKKMIMDILRSVEGGSSLSSAFSMYPNEFSITYQSLVRAGESSGKLDEILKKLADNMEADRDLNSRFKSAMIYPAIVFLAMIGVFVILMIFVIPKLAEMYENMNVELPAITKGMIALSEFMVNYIFIILILVVALVILVRTFLKSDQGKILWSEVMSRLPVFGKINKQKDYATFSRTLSLLINSAVPIVDSLNIVASIMSNLTLKKAVLNSAAQIEKGTSLSTYFRSDPNFPPLLSQMAGVGEETGKMDEVLDRVAVYYEGEVSHLVKGLSSALEPIILVMLGGMVGFLIVSIITPIYKITSAI